MFILREVLVNDDNLVALSFKTARQLNLLRQAVDAELQALWICRSRADKAVLR